MGSSSGITESHNVPFLGVPNGVPQIAFQSQSFFGYTTGQPNELQIRAAQLRDKEYLLSDGEGLYLRVRPTGKA